MSTPTRTVSYTFNTLDPWLKITWRTRPDTSSPWATVTKKYPASFFVTDAQPLCDHDFFVAGVYADGNTTIEQWTWGLYPRDPYQERRTVLYRGTSLGHVRSVSPDPQGRFILILTHENAGVYRRALPSGSPVLLFDKTSVPELQEMMRMYPVNHATQGRKFKFSRYRSSQDRRSANGPAVLLPDANNDGVFDPPVAVTSVQWVALGYDQPGIWSYPAICQ